MLLAHDQGDRDTQSDLEPGFIRAIPSYKTVGAAEEMYGRLVPLHLLRGPTELYTRQYGRKDGNKVGATEGNQESMSDSQHFQPTIQLLQKILTSFTRELTTSLTLGPDGKDPTGAQGLQVADGRSATPHI